MSANILKGLIHKRTASLGPIDILIGIDLKGANTTSNNFNHKNAQSLVHIDKKAKVWTTHRMAHTTPSCSMHHPSSMYAHQPLDYLQTITWLDAIKLSKSRWHAVTSYTSVLQLLFELEVSIPEILADSSTSEPGDPIQIHSLSLFAIKKLIPSGDNSIVMKVTDLPT